MKMHQQFSIENKMCYFKKGGEERRRTFIYDKGREGGSTASCIAYRLHSEYYINPVALPYFHAIQGISAFDKYYVYAFIFYYVFFSLSPFCNRPLFGEPSGI